MKTLAKIAPPNSVVLVEDVGGGDVPASLNGELVTATSSCIAVGCMCEMDGETLLTIGSEHEVDPGYPPAFEGKLATPNRKIVLRSAENQTILEQDVTACETMIRVWVNDAREPDNVTVGIVREEKRP